MTSPLAGMGASPDPRAVLRKQADQMESMFFAQMLTAMRASVTDGGLELTSSGERMFTAMLDEQMAAQAAEQATGGLSEALYRQLVSRLPAAPETASPGNEGVSSDGSR